MSPELVPEDNSCRTRTMAGYAVGITSHNAARLPKTNSWGLRVA